MSTEREKILGRIREALTVVAPHPGHHEAHLPAPPKSDALKIAEELIPQPGVSQWLPLVGESFEEQAALFAANSADLKTDFRLLSATETLAGELARLSAEEGWTRIATHRGELTNAACGALKLETVFTDQPYEATKLETCEVGISECDVLIAQTGSVVITSKSAGGRALTVLPPHHVVLVKREQMVADLPMAFVKLREKYGTDYPSLISFITGPSRTGDIERILVLGAHGPKKLTVLCQ
jgi:L-lactate dehydrogenase complex protein LldG